jgi:hypothetical protein
MTWSAAVFYKGELIPLHILYCSIWLQPCLNFTVRFLQTEHLMNVNQWKVKYVFYMTGMFPLQTSPEGTELHSRCQGDSFTPELKIAGIYGLPISVSGPDLYITVTTNTKHKS